MSSMQTIEKPLASMVGLVRWFDKSMGYGFVTDLSDETDILLHANTLREFGVSMAMAGASIEFEFEETDRGIRVAKVLSLSNRSQPDQSANNEGSFDWEPVKVNWFDKQKGFGFVRRHCESDDIFIGSKTLINLGTSDLASDQALSARIFSNELGDYVHELRPW